MTISGLQSWASGLDYFPAAVTKQPAKARDERFTWTLLEGAVHHHREGGEECEATGHIVSTERCECWSQFICYLAQDPSPWMGAVHMLGGSSYLSLSNLDTSSATPPEACFF